MFPDKLTLIEQINSVIKRNSCDQNFRNGLRAIKDGDTKNRNELNGQCHNHIPEENELLKKLEQRVRMLEEQDDHLLQFIHFLFENLSNLVREIVISDFESQNKNNPELDGIKKQFHCAKGGKESPSVTPREMDVLNLLVKGLCAKEIATALFISETTVITHKKHLKEKFHAKNTVELISNVLNNGS
ncbi:MAG TPA: LuxR C-terminal-related transcriptional regulator [Cyclobacteriaceae bacterium]|jgi:DNA-binding CsgD family transcriptional regulator|nr:LuxR C-terminal-related transcriptional regulator [Cyclobacteriaceae bacterium]